jgi:RAD51-like protein 3
MRLVTLVPTVLSSDLAVLLGKCGIRTDTDLLFSSTIEIYRQLPINSISLAGLEELRARVAEVASATGYSGLELLQQQDAVRGKFVSLSSGVAEIDDLLGGFGGCRVLEISGNVQSGKTV